MFKKTREELIAFEKRIIDFFEEGKLPFLIHLSGGNEDQLINIFKNINEGDYILSTHRSHYHYLLAGGSEKDLEEKILNGESMHIFNKKLNFMTTSILAGGAAIAAGIAHALKMEQSSNRVYCFIGDGAEDEGHFYEAVQYVWGWDLPCTFIIEDNDRSVWSTKTERRGNLITQWPYCVKRYEYKITMPHAGTGTGKMIDFSKYKRP
jgi:pyruvate dehydrogenase E1 component alpha subunit